MRDHPESLTPDLDLDRARGIGPCRRCALDTDHVVRVALAENLGNRELWVVHPYDGPASRPSGKDIQVPTVQERVGQSVFQRHERRRGPAVRHRCLCLRPNVDEALRIDGVHGEVRAVDGREHDAARILEPRLAPGVLIGCRNRPPREPDHAAADEEEQLWPPWRALHGFGDARDRFEHAESAQAAGIVQRVDCERAPRHVHDSLGCSRHPGARILSVDGVQQPGAVRGQVLNRAGLNGAVVRGDDGGEIVRAEGLDGGRGNLPGGDGRLLDGNRPIHQDDDQPSVLLADLIGDDVGGHVAGPNGLARARPRKLDRREGANRRLDAVVEHGEVRGGQRAHGLPLVVQDDHVELQQLDAGAELWAFVLSLREEPRPTPGCQGPRN